MLEFIYFLCFQKFELRQPIRKLNPTMKSGPLDSIPRFSNVLRLQLKNEHTLKTRKR